MCELGCYLGLVLLFCVLGPVFGSGEEVLLSSDLVGVKKCRAMGSADLRSRLLSRPWMVALKYLVCCERVKQCWYWLR